MEPPVEPVPAIEDFPEDGGLRAHVRWAVELYERLRADAHRMLAGSSVLAPGRA